jgi:glutathione S-transferase
MRLFYSPTSPYVRKVQVTAIEKGLGERLTLVPCNAYAPAPELWAANPLGRVPTLVLDDGTALFDSPVICDWLDAAGSGPGLLPPAGPQRWGVLRAQALADGVMDEAVAVVMGRRRPGQDSALEASALAAVGRGLNWLEGQPQAWTRGLDLGQIAVACALGYLDFRLPELCWAQTRPGLAAWYGETAKRESFRTTVPQQPPA